VSRYSPTNAVGNGMNTTVSNKKPFANMKDADDLFTSANAEW
jgi:hypothetical protein